MIQWDESNKCLTDSMGMPISRTLALEYRDAIKAHLKHSAADLASIALKQVKDRYPGMVERQGFTPEQYE